MQTVQKDRRFLVQFLAGVAGMVDSAVHVEVPLLQFYRPVVDIPALVVQTVLLGVPQLQLTRQSSTFLVWRRGRWGTHCLKTARFHSCSLSAVRGNFLEPSMMKSSSSSRAVGWAHHTGDESN